MSKKPYKSQASSSRAFASAFAAQSGSNNIRGWFGDGSDAFPSSPISYVYEPPDISAISEPTVIVAFKNLQKRDTTTKIKALEELQSHISAIGTKNGRVEETVVEAWVKLYPRTSIDNARQVRRLAHLVQGQISVSCGKRIARYMQHIIGAWLAGLYDNDRSVARAALDSLKQVFPSEEKMKNLWRVYLPTVTQFAIDAVTKETSDTLSDSQVTTPEDAAAKYARVVGISVSMMTNAIGEVLAQNHIREEPLIQEFLTKRKVWEYAADSDPFVRRSIYRLAIAAARNVKEFLDPSLICATMLKKALSIQHAGSIVDYARALIALTSEIPEIWSQLDQLSNNKSACQRLCDFLKKGSQAGPPDYWNQIVDLIKLIPLKVRMTVSESRTGKDIATFPVLDALHAGIVSSDEPRANQIPAWNAYLDAADFFVSSVSSQTSRDDIVKHSMVPILRQYVKPSSDEANWTIGGLIREDLCVRAVQQSFYASPEKLQEAWSHLSHDIIEAVEKQPPNQSEDDLNLKNSICACIIRWYGLQTAVFKSVESHDFRRLISQGVISELNEALKILEERAGETLSAAVLLENALKMPPEIFQSEDKIMTAVMNFAQNQIPKLLFSPSAPHLIVVLPLLTNVIEINPLCEAGIMALYKAPDSAAKSVSLQGFATSRLLAQANEIGILKSIVIDYLEMALKGDESRWELVMAALNNPVAPHGLIDDMFARMMASLSIKEEQLPSLHGLDLVLNRKGQTVKALVGFSGGSHLLSKLLLLAESSNDELSIIARDLSIAIELCVTTEKGSSHAVKSMIEIINQSLNVAGPESLSVDSLVQYARRLLDQSTPADRATLVSALLPSPLRWSRAMMPLMTQSPSLSFSHISPLGGAIALINSNAPPSDDLDSSAFRMASYSVKLFRSSSSIDLTTLDQAIIIKNLALLHQSATHNLSVLRPNPLRETVKYVREPEICNFSAEIDYMLTVIGGKEQITESLLMTTLQQQLLDDSRNTSPASYYSACAFLSLQSKYNQESRKESLEPDAEQTEPFSESSDIFRTLAILRVTSDTTRLVKELNEVLANLVGREFEKQVDAVLRQLVLLNCILSTNVPALITKIPKQRLVFFVKHSVSQLCKGKLSNHITSEVLKALSALIPSIRDVYDSFWEQMIDFIKNTLSPPNQFLHDDNIPLLHATLELFASLKVLRLEGSNEDLEDVWTEKEVSLLNGLLDLLKECQGASDDHHVPRHQVNLLLARQLEDFSNKMTGEFAELYGVLACESSALQLAAYHILHYQIPNAQGQISLDKALEKEFYAKLPDELLSLLVDAPSPKIFSEADFARVVPHPLRSYLLGWKLTFDHWTDSSDQTKADYAAALKEGSLLQSLLDFTFQILITNRSKPFNASTIEKSSFVPGTLKSLEEETHGLLVHLYYLSLKNLPSLCRSWWRDTTSRQTASAVETWTEKYISPLIITSELQAISAWAPSQSTAEQPMDLKVSPSTCEITASIPLDEQALQISIRLPPSYPLARASVDSLRRVAVDEKKWRGWLITTQGVINFTADGGQPIIEGLLAWRRNVTATLKGQTECAICYSVVGSDRQLPSKRCGTCKNCFHGGCLFKWFKSSNSSSCPLCRNAFNYA